VSGYIRLHRSLLGHHAFRNDAEAMAFAWMVAKAAWREVRVRYKGHGVHLQRGQLCVSQRDMAAALDRDKAWVERLWRRMISEAMIETRREAAAMVITICNYDRFQVISEDSEAANEAVREAVNEADVRQTRGTEQGREEYKKDPSVAKATSVAHARHIDHFAVCPPGVDPAHWRDFRENRRKKKLANTETAYQAQLRDLAKFSDDEWPPGRVLQHAAERGWGAIFDPRPTSRNFNGNRSGNQGRYADRMRDGVLQLLADGIDP